MYAPNVNGIYVQEGSKEPQEYEDILARCVFAPDSLEVEDKLKVNINGNKTAWVCKTCQGYLQRNKMPPTCHKNKLEIIDHPDLQWLTKFENTLIATEIPFMFITRLRVSRMEALKGKDANRIQPRFLPG